MYRHTSSEEIQIILCILSLFFFSSDFFFFPFFLYLSLDFFLLFLVTVYEKQWPGDEKPNKYLILATTIWTSRGKYRKTLNPILKLWISFCSSEQKITDYLYCSTSGFLHLLYQKSFAKRDFACRQILVTIFFLFYALFHLPTTHNNYNNKKLQCNFTNEYEKINKISPKIWSTFFSYVSFSTHSSHIFREIVYNIMYLTTKIFIQFYMNGFCVWEYCQEHCSSIY